MSKSVPFLLKNALKTVLHMGIPFCAFRACYELEKKTGILKSRFVTPSWDEIRLKQLISLDSFKSAEQVLTHCNKFFFEIEKPPSFFGMDGRQLVICADKILNNEFRYFFRNFYSLGDGPDWFLNPVTGAKGDGEKHWCDIRFFDTNVGDIKFIWEPSRFAWAYTLARAYSHTGDEKYAEKFWKLFESWMDANQPNRGHNYACGQECAIRTMAMCFALFAFNESMHTTSDRRELILKAIYIHSDRIEKNISFAISTRTNHSITEAAGIFTVGLLFPFLKNAKRWKEKGEKILVKEAARQIYSDGSYIQHSMNYHRLMLQDYIWVLRLAELNNVEISKFLREKVKRAVDFIYQMQDESGRVPNYGANDGALICPLNNCDYLDYRPVIQAGYYLFDKIKIYPNGPWDEDLLWFFGNNAVKSPVENRSRQNSAFDEGGYYTLRNSQSWAMTRCHSFRDRPGQADMLHLDLWWKGINILRDSGSFMYYCDEPWQNYFSSTAVHNTISIDGRSQMQKYGKFMWFDWIKSDLLRYDIKSNTKILAGQHYGYTKSGKNIIHRRNILSADENLWIIIDDVIGKGRHLIDLYWHLCDAPCEFDKNICTLNTERGLASICVITSNDSVQYQLFKGNEQKPAGWQSLYYGERIPAPTLLSSANFELPKRIVTVIAFGGLQKADLTDNRLSIVLSSSKEYKLQLGEISTTDVVVRTTTEKLL